MKSNNKGLWIVISLLMLLIIGLILNFVLGS